MTKPFLYGPAAEVVPDVAGGDVLPALQAEREAEEAEQAAKEAFKEKLRSIGFVRIPKAAK